MKIKFICSIVILLLVFSLFAVLPISAAPATIKLSGATLISPGQELLVNVDFSNLSSTAPEGLGGIGQIKISYNSKLFDLIKLDKSESITSNFDFTTSKSTIKVNDIDLDVITISIKSNIPNSVIPPSTTNIAYLSFRAKDIAQEKTAEFAILNDSSGFVNPTNPTLFYDDKIGIEAPLKVYVGKKLSNNAKLSALSIENLTISPEFSSENKLYSANLIGDISEIKVNYLVQEPNSTVAIIGDKELKDGNNRVSVQVTAPDGFTVMEYVINIKKVTDATASNVIDNEEKIKQLTSEVESLSLKLNNSNERFIYFAVISAVIILFLIICIITFAVKQKSENERINGLENLDYDQFDDQDDNN